MNKKLSILKLKLIFFFLCCSTVIAEETAVTEKIAETKEIKIETTKEAEESQSIIEQTMAADADADADADLTLKNRVPVMWRKKRLLRNPRHGFHRRLNMTGFS